MDEPSAELIERWRHGDSTAADVLFHRYMVNHSAMVQRHISPSLRRRIDPEDAVHSAYRSFFVRVTRGDFSLPNSGDLWKLLVTISLNKLRRLISHHQAQKRSIRREQSLESVSINSINGPSPLEALATVDELETFMSKLTPTQRMILEMRLQDRTWSEISQATGKPDRTVRRVIEEIRDRWTQEASEIHVEPIQSQPEKLVVPLNSQPRDTVLNAFLNYGDFMLNELIGMGGSSKVYQAWQKSENRPVAVKMLLKSDWSSAQAIERFLQEARTISQIPNTGIVKTHGVGKTPQGGFFIVMDLIEGPTLAQIISQRTLSVRESVEWMTEVAVTLDHVHRAGIIHCDLKPSNLLRDASGRMVIGDFGLAQTVNHEVRTWGGTPGYMAPEQLDYVFGEISPATDIFSLGLVLARLLTGRKVFEGHQLLERLKSHDAIPEWWRTPIDHEMPDGLSTVISKCLEIDPASRYSSMLELAEALRAIDLSANCPVYLG